MVPADATRTSAAAAPQTPALAGLRLLFVDDNDLVREATNTLLEAHGAAVDVRADALEALEYLHEISTAVDAILMDVQMPGMDGYEATRRIHAQPRWQAVPVIGLTATLL